MSCDNMRFFLEKDEWKIVSQLEVNKTEYPTVPRDKNSISDLQPWSLKIEKEMSPSNLW